MSAHARAPRRVFPLLVLLLLACVLAMLGEYLRSHNAAAPTANAGANAGADSGGRVEAYDGYWFGMTYEEARSLQNEALSLSDFPGIDNSMLGGSKFLTYADLKNDFGRPATAILIFAPSTHRLVEVRVVIPVKEGGGKCVDVAFDEIIPVLINSHPDYMTPEPDFLDSRWVGESPAGNKVATVQFAFKRKGDRVMYLAMGGCKQKQSTIQLIYVNERFSDLKGKVARAMGLSKNPDKESR